MEFNREYFLNKIRFLDSPLRKGQVLYGEVAKHYPNECQLLTGSVYDCFYRDDQIDSFLGMVEYLINNKEYFPKNKNFSYIQAVLKNEFDFHNEKIEVKSPWKEKILFYRLGESMEKRKIREENQK